ncbi:MAG: CsiV family protein [Pseudomonadota bacterium]|nr:CsiV family protein [Pseudomonadota bacterium]
MKQTRLRYNDPMSVCVRIPLLFLAIVVPWVAGVAQPPASTQVGPPFIEPPIDKSQPGLPMFQVEVIAFAYGPFDPSEEEFPAGRKTDAKDILSEGARRIPSFGLSEQAMEDLFGPTPQPASEELLGELEILPENQFIGVEMIEQIEVEEAVKITDSDTPEEPNIQLTEFSMEPRRNTEELSRFRLLQPDELELTGSYARLRAIDAYTPLFHSGWVQEGPPEEEAQPVDVTLLGSANPKGTITLYLSRFLHLIIDLRYYAETWRLPGAVPAQIELKELELVPRYELALERRIRSGQLNYFDHPAFGVLVVIRPHSEELGESKETGEPAA